MDRGPGKGMGRGFARGKLLKETVSGTSGGGDAGETSVSVEDSAAAAAAHLPTDSGSSAVAEPVATAATTEVKRKVGLGRGMKKEVADVGSADKEAAQVAESVGALEVTDREQFADAKASTGSVETPEVGDASNQKSGSSSRQHGFEEKSSLGGATPSSPPQDKLPVVRKGEKGIPVQVCTNFVRMRVKRDRGVHEYRVDFEPQLDSLRHRKHAINQFADTLGEARMFDGHMLFLPLVLTDSVMVLEGSSPEDPAESLKVTIKYVKEKPAHELVQFFNILFRRVMNILGRIEMKNNFFDIRTTYKIPQHKLEIWPGMCIAVEQREGGLMLNMDSTSRVLRTDTVLDHLNAVKGQANYKDLFARDVIGTIVLTRYNNKTYRIDDISWDLNPEATFERYHKGNTFQMSYVDYYQKVHNQCIEDMDQPLLMSQLKPRKGEGIRGETDGRLVALVPELCYTTGLSDELRSNFTVMKDIGQFTRVNPQKRVVAMEKFLANIRANPDAMKVFNLWNLEFQDKPMQLAGRQIAGPSLTFGPRNTVKEARPDFSRDSVSSVYEPITLKSWVIICTKRDSDKAKRFIDLYRQLAPPMGIRIEGTGLVVTINGQSPNDFRRALEANSDLAKIQFVVCLMPSLRDDVYAAIKRFCVVERGIPSQCIVTKTLMNEKRVRSVTQKIILQINCKLGGGIWSLNIPLKEKIMFVGMDVCHDPKKKLPSVMALVASMNNECTRFVSKVLIQRVHQEQADTLRQPFEDICDAYIAMNGGPPDRIIVYRDGGSETTVDALRRHECKQLSVVVKDRIPSLQNFTFVVAGKRIHERMILCDQRGNPTDNPKPGTVLDHTITQRYMYDFFLVSQLVGQGTVTPAHYIVVEDRGDIKPDLIQKFTYATSFMYFNWPGTIRVPAPVQYAHKLASLVGTHLQRNPKENMKGVLYFL